MLTFHRLTLADKERFDAWAREENSRSADYNFGTMFLWDSAFPRFVADAPFHLILLRAEGRQPAFLWPIGNSDKAAVIAAAREYAAANGSPLVFRGLEERHAAALEALMPGAFEITEERDWADYVYEAEKLATLAGKHLHGKRNHINRFLDEHDEWRFEPLVPEMFDECWALLEGWTEHADTDQGLPDGERAAISRAFENFDALGLLGGALYADGQLLGFTLGNKISEDAFQVRFEKARGDMNGAYPMVNREFVRLILERYPEIRYVNREDDMGLENLRKSKESYYPAFLIRKFTAREKAAL